MLTLETSLARAGDGDLRSLELVGTSPSPRMCSGSQDSSCSWVYREGRGELKAGWLFCAGLTHKPSPAGHLECAEEKEAVSFHVIGVLERNRI